MNTPAVPASVTRGSLVEARGIYKSFGQTPALRGTTVARSTSSWTVSPRSLRSLIREICTCSVYTLSVYSQT